MFDTCIHKIITFKIMSEQTFEADINAIIATLKMLAEDCRSRLADYNEITGTHVVDSEEMVISEELCALCTTTNNYLNLFMSYLINVQNHLRSQLPDFGNLNNHNGQTLEYCLQQVQEQKEFCLCEIIETQNFFAQLTNLFPPAKVEHGVNDKIEEVVKESEFERHHVKHWVHIIQTYEWKFKIDLQEIDARASWVKHVLVRNIGNICTNQANELGKDFYS